MTLDSLETPAQAFLDWIRIEKGRSPRTIASYGQDLIAFEETIKDRHTSLLAVTPEDIDAHLEGLRQRGRSPATIARSRSCLKGLYQFLVDEGELGLDPTTSAGAVRVPSRLPKALSEDEIERLIDSVTGDDPLAIRDRAILELLYGTGARVSEVVRLDLSDMAYDDGLLRLVGKGDKERLVPLGRPAQAAIARWSGSEGRDRIHEKPATSRTDLQALFLNKRGTRISRQGIHLLVQTRAQRAGLSAHVSPHVLRHSCATHMLAHGADVRVVQELLGHASVATTQLYTKVSLDHLNKAYLLAHPRAHP